VADDDRADQLTWRAAIRLPTEVGEWIEARARRMGLRPGEVLRIIVMDRWHDEQAMEHKQTEHP